MREGVSDGEVGAPKLHLLAAREEFVNRSYTFEAEDITNER
jgi:hypothetical protein